MRRPVFTSAILQTLTGVAIAGLSGCAQLYDDRCGPESRDVTALERIRSAAGDSIGLAVVSLVEVREPEHRSMDWFIASEDLRGHLHVPRLVATEDTSSVLLELPGVVNSADIILEGGLDPYIGPVSFDALFRRAASGGLTMILETDIPAYSRIALPLRVETFNDWGQAHCS